MPPFGGLSQFLFHLASPCLSSGVAFCSAGCAVSPDVLSVPKCSLPAAGSAAKRWLSTESLSRIVPLAWRGLCPCCPRSWPFLGTANDWRVNVGTWRASPAAELPVPWAEDFVKTAGQLSSSLCPVRTLPSFSYGCWLCPQISTFVSVFWGTQPETSLKLKKKHPRLSSSSSAIKEK